MKKVIVFLSFICLIFGTNNYQELNNLSIITNIGITYKNSKYKILFQEIIPSRENNKLENNYKYYEAFGSTLSDTLKNIEEIIPKRIYLNHLENVIVNSSNDKVLNELGSYFKNDLDNFNIIYTPNSVNKVIKYSNNYKYINSIIKNNISYRTYKKNELEHNKSKIPIITMKKDILIFYKYRKLGEIYE